MQYDLNQLSDPKRFQRLVNAILSARFGEDARLTPIQGRDGGSDGETADANPNMEFVYDIEPTRSNNPLTEPPRPGRYLFQAKYHRTGEHRLSDLRSVAVREFKQSLIDDVLKRPDRQNVNYFILVTNISASADSIRKIDDVRSELLKGKHHLHADVWWSERITTWLDWSPDLWHAYPELFPGGVPPVLALATTPRAEGLSRTLQLAVTQQYERDSQVKFRQIELKQRLLDLFVDLDANFFPDTDDTARLSFRRVFSRPSVEGMAFEGGVYRLHRMTDSALHLLLDDTIGIPRILLEGGPGQGKSTITQMVAQVYREKFLANHESETREPTWHRLCQLRVPIRLELRDLAHWIGQDPEGTLEQYIVRAISRDSGGAEVSVEDLHHILQRSSLILLLDGLDEIGNDLLRDKVLDAAMEAINRFEKGLRTDVRVVLTTRPPAVLGRWDKLKGFTRVVLTPMEPNRIDEYVNRWLSAQVDTSDERNRIKTSFNSRRAEPHVQALARNPMQLSVLLQFIDLKGEAFPDRRAELYRDYFQIVIDRDVEKSPELREHRELVEGLHSYLGFRLHGIAESEPSRRALSRNEIIDLSGEWLEGEGESKNLADTYFALGEERYGLIVALSGEGHETAYGFEVQPIQEYFSAAYISNRLEDGRAHAVFESLIYRDYWREVALFLAGLRRPNEKADLVARAKASDTDVSVPGRQKGRAIILELLREGVLSQPRHVQMEALRFALGFLNTPTLRLQSAPGPLIESLAELVKLYGDDEVNNNIVQLVDSCSKCNDYELISFLHRLASIVLPKERYLKIVLGYEGVVPETRGLVRVTRPFDVPGLLQELGSNHTYWEGIPASVLARRLWSAVTRKGVIPQITYPTGTHLSLVLEFAIGRTGSPRRDGGVIRTNGASVLAIWKLYRNVKLIGVMGEEDRKDTSTGAQTCLEDKDGAVSWTNGQSEALPPDVEKCLRELIEASDFLIKQLHSGKEKSIKQGCVGYLKVIKEHVDQPGITGWVAGRCAAEFMQGPLTSVHDLGADEVIDEISGVLHTLYHRPDRAYPRGPYYIERVALGIPHAVRLAYGAAMRPVHEVLADMVLDRANPSELRHCRWLQDVPLSPSVIKPLVESCRKEMETLLRFIGLQRVSSGLRYYSSRRLSVNDTRRVLKICRDTQDPVILQGASILLMSATFARISEPGVILKVLSAAPASPFVAEVFDTRESVRGEERGPHFRKLGLDVARMVIEQADMYSFRLVNRAAVFVNEVEASRSSPLFQDCPNLLRFA